MHRYRKVIKILNFKLKQFDSYCRIIGKQMVRFSSPVTNGI